MAEKIGQEILIVKGTISRAARRLLLAKVV
jgi:hypothetical protein